MSESEQQPNTVITNTDDVGANGNVKSVNNATLATAPPAAVKRFSSANISKKFLQKTPAVSRTNSQNSVARAVSPATTTAASSPANNTPTPVHHSRLVATKLTSSAAAPSAASGSSPSGWPSRSTAPSPATASTTTSQNQTAGTPIIVSPPNASAEARSSTPTKTAWSKRTPSSEAPASRVPASDFPTAAEVAQAQASKTQPLSHPEHAETDAPKTSTTTATHKDDQTADAFRGVHLDPNAHHWDDEDEDPDFFEDVIEFADGRQYNVSHAPTTAAPDLPISATPSVKPPTASQSATVSQPHIRSTSPARSNRRRFSNDDHEYDRTWPRGNSNHHQPPRSHYSNSPRINGHPLASPALSHSTLMSDRDRDRDHHSWQNSGDRQLFNERSNRLEPYGGSKSGDRSGGNAWARGPPSHFSSRDRERERDVPPHQSHPTLSPGSHHSTLSPSTGPRNAWGDRDRRMDYGEKGGGFSRAPSSYRRLPSDRERDMPPPRSPVETSWTRGRRASNVSTHSAMSGTGGLGITGLTGAAVRTVSGSINGVEGHGAEEQKGSSVSGDPPQPEAQSTEEATPQMNLSELTKVAMHTAAERARIRRQEEEAEREAQKERARKKADELEKLIREKKEKEEREKKEKEEKEAREKAEREERERKQREESERTKSPGSARPKLALLPRSIPVPGSSTQSNDGLNAPAMKSPGPPSSKPLPPPSRADESGSWRSTAAPRTSRPQPSTSNAPPAMSNVSHAIEMLDNAVAEKAGDVPVIDFSDVGKLMAAENPSQVTAPPKRRPVASDFMEDDSPKFPTIGTHPSETSSVDSVTRGKKDAPTPLSTASPARRTVPLGQKSPGLHAPHYPQHRDKPSLPYKEAPLSSLSDAMSRIKATLDNMHQASASQSSSKASTSSSPQISPSPKPSVESFTVTREDDPLPSASSNEEVKVPKSAPAQKNKKKRVEQIPKSKLASFWRPRSEDEDLGWRVLSWDPPVNGMSKRSMSRDEVVFGLSGGGWGSKISTGGSKVKVQLPKEKIKEKSEVQLDDLAEDIKPMPQNVNSKPSDTASHGSSSPRLSLSRGKSLPAGTDVAFYKPPQVVINGATGSEETLTGIPSTSSVKFTVTSELEEGDSSSTVEKTEGQAESLPNGASADESVVASLHESTQSDEKSDETPSSMSASASTLLTPPPPLPATAATTTSWAKSPLVFPVSPDRRAPDSEHLKAVWSQTPDDTVNTENSLKGISDEFPGTTLPHSVQEMKSDDGGDGGAKSESTPVPTLPESAEKTITTSISTTGKSQRPEGTPSRMALRDPHRAFQQVPPSPAQSNASVPSYNPMGAMNHPSAPQTNGIQARPPTSQAYTLHPQAQPYTPQHPPFAMSPYPQHSASPAPGNYPVRSFHTGSSPNMMWSQPSMMPPPYPTTAPSPGPTRMPLPPHAVGVPPNAMPQGVWMPPPQPVSSPAPPAGSPYAALNGQAQFVYMPPHPAAAGSMPKGVGMHGAMPHHQHPPTHATPASGMNGYLSPQMQRQHPVSANSHQPPGTPQFMPRQPMMSPHMYPSAPLPHTGGYSMPVGTGRGNGHPGGHGAHHHLQGPRTSVAHFELPPPPPPNPSMYPPAPPTRFAPTW